MKAKGAAPQHPKLTRCSTAQTASGCNLGQLVGSESCGRVVAEVKKKSYMEFWSVVGPGGEKKNEVLHLLLTCFFSTPIDVFHCFSFVEKTIPKF